MNERKRVLLLILIMAFVCIIVAGIMATLLYNAGFEEERVRLVETAQSQARLIEAVAQFDAVYSKKDHPEGAIAATMSQIKDAHSRYKGFGQTGEFTLARRDGEMIIFLLRHRHYDLDRPKPVSFDSDLAEPMRRALSGQSGTMVGLDYRGEMVLGAYEPVAVLNMGIVAKIDLDEIRAPFLRAGAIAGGLMVIVVLCGAILFVWISNPIIRRLKEHSKQLEQRVEKRTIELSMANEDLAQEIEGRKQIEERLRGSEGKYRQLVETLQEGIWVIDKDAYTTFANPCMAEMLGYTVDEMQGKHLFSFMDEAGVKIANRNLERRKQGIKERHDFEFLRKDGTRIYTSLGTSPLTDDDGNYLGAIAAVTDLTERVRVEAERQRIYDLPTTLIMIAKSDTTIVRVAAGWENTLGYSPKEMVGRSFLDFIHPDDMPESRDETENIAAGKIMPYFENRYRHKDGTYRVLLWAANADPITGLHYGFAQDITDHKKVEEELKFHYVIVENMTEGVCLVRVKDAVIVYTNPRFDKMFGYEAGELKGKPVTIVNYESTHKTSEQVAREIMQQLTEHGEATYEVQNVKKDGTPFWCRANTAEFVHPKYGKVWIAVHTDITESKQAENALLESENKFRSISASAKDGIIMIDNVGNISYWNEAAKKIFGYTKEEALGKEMHVFLGPERYHEAYKRGFSRFKKTGQGPVIGKTLEISAIRKDGVEFPIELSVSAVKIGGKWHSIGVIRDITKRKQTEKDLLESERKYRQKSKVLDAVNRVFREALTCESEQDVADTCLCVAENITGSKFGFIGELNQAGLFDDIAISNPGWDACKMPDSEAAVLIKNMKIRGIDRSVVREEKSRIVNDLTSHPDRIGFPEGHPPVTSFLGVPLKHAGETIGMIGLGNKESGYDLADQQAIEDLSVAFVEALMRKRGEMALNIEREKFRVLVEESPLGVSLIGEDGVYKYVNPRFVELFGYTLKDIPDGRVWFRKAHLDPGYRAQVISTWVNILKESKQGEVLSPHIWSVTCKDGSMKVIQFIPVSLATGGQFVIYEDLTEQKKLEAQFRQSQKMEGIGRLAGGIAHDFNNLLTTIIGHAELTLMQVDKESPLRDGMEEIKKASDRAAALTHQLLAFSRKQMIQPVVLNINHTIAEMDTMLRRLIGEDLDLATILEPELWNTKFDVGQMNQVVMNLAVNARDAMPKGGRLTIETANVDLDHAYARQHGIELKPGPFVMLALSDTGFGMDEETESHIFEPFFTTKENGKGTGLGLSTVYGIVKQSGGYIWVYSEPGQGTTFKIYLPNPAKPEPKFPI